MRRVFDVVREPRGEVMRRLLHGLARLSSSVLMVVRDDLGLDPPGQMLLARLRPHLLSEERGRVWPGTVLLGGDATILRFALSEAVLAELAAVSDGLYGWRQPELPEDLAFLRADGTAILASVCHERDAYIDLSDDEYQSLTTSIPGILRVVLARVAQ